MEITDVAGPPRAKLTLFVQPRIGDRIKLSFQLQRNNAGRHEILVVSGDYRVTQTYLDATQGPPRQILAVEAVGKAPNWRAVKKPSEFKRQIPPAIFPRTVVA